MEDIVWSALVKIEVCATEESHSLWIGFLCSLGLEGLCCWCYVMRKLNLWMRCDDFCMDSVDCHVVETHGIAEKVRSVICDGLDPYPGVYTQEFLSFLWLDVVKTHGDDGNGKNLVLG